MPDDRHVNLPPRETYWTLSKSPLQSLIFLLPLLIIYELAVPTWGSASPQQAASEIYARRLIFYVFDLLGIGVVFLPMLLIVIVLLCWHIGSKDRWRLELKLYPWMWVESLAWTMPLFIGALLWYRFLATSGAMLTADAGDALMSLDPPLLMGIVATTAQAQWQSELLLAVGAGLYEELLFRLLGITLLHMLLVDYLRVERDVGVIIVVGLTSVAFALYHFSEKHPFNMGDFLFFTTAGVYLAIIFLYRGFGIVAATHAIYDVLAYLVFITDPA